MRKTMFAILAMSITLLMYLAISPLLAEIAKSFPDVSTSGIQLVFTIVSLSAFPAMFITGKLIRYISKKTLILTGLFLIACGMLPLILNTKIWMLYISSILNGLGMGIVNVLSSTLISDYFKGLDKHRMMGYQSAAVSVGGTVLPIVSGNIAVTNWVNSFLVYIICIPIIILVFILLPKDRAVRQQVHERAVLGKRLFYMALLGFFSSVFTNAFNTNIAMYLKYTNLGDASVAGFVNSMYTFLGIPTGLIIGYCIRIFGRHLITLAALLVAAGFLFISVGGSLLLIYAGSFLIGLGFSLRAPATITFATNMVQEGSAALGIMIINSFSSLGNFVSPFVINTVSGLFGSDIKSKMILCSVSMAVIGIVMLIKNPVKKEEVILNE